MTCRTAGQLASNRRASGLPFSHTYENAVMRISMHDCYLLNSAPIRATVVKRAYESDPVTMRAAGLGLTVLLDPSSQLPGVFSPRGQGSSWSARSRAAARTNELDAGKRRKIIEGEEGGLVADWLMRGSCACSRRVAGGVVSQAPIRRRASMRAAAMTMYPGPGCSVM